MSKPLAPAPTRTPKATPSAAGCGKRKSQKTAAVMAVLKQDPPAAPSAGDPCENYCRGLRQLCEEEADLLGDTCVDECRKLPLAGTTFVHPAKNGNTFECRAYHLQLTVGTERSLHCQHTIGQGPPNNQPCAKPNP